MLTRIFAACSLLVLVAGIPFSTALAVHEVWFGNLDGSPMSVRPGDTLDLPIWIVSVADDPIDSLGFVHMPLATNDSFIVARLIGAFTPPFQYDLWEDLSFLLHTDLNQPVPGWTSQSVIGFCQVPVGIDPNGDPPAFHSATPVLMGWFKMVAANDTNLVGQTIACLREGYNPWNGDCYWGDQYGIDSWVPIQHYGAFHFSSNVTSCIYVRGDINDDMTVNSLDLTFGVNYLKGGTPPQVNCNPPCTGQSPHFYAAMDVNGNCSANGIDITYFVGYLKGIQPALLHCGDCLPTGG